MTIEISKRGVLLVCNLWDADSVEAFKVLQDEGFLIRMLHLKGYIGLDSDDPQLYVGGLSAFIGMRQIVKFAHLAGSVAREQVAMAVEEEEENTFRVPRECLFVADISEPDAIQAIEAIQKAGFWKKVLHVPGYEGVDFSQPHFYCGEYSHKGADLIIDFVQRAGNRQEWREALAG